MMRLAPYLAGASALVAMLWPLGMWAQVVADDDGGARLVADLEMRFELEDGEPIFRPDFNIDLISATRTQRLSFSTDVGLELDFQDFDTEWRDPNYQLDYIRDNGQSRLTALAAYQSSDIDGQILDLTTEFDETDLIEDDGTRENRRLNLGLEIGLQDPFGAAINYSYSDTIYSGTSDPDLFDSTDTELSGNLRFDINRTLRIVLDASTLTSDSDNPFAEQTTTDRTGLGVNWQFRPDIALDARIGYGRIEREQTIFAISTTTITEGVEGRVGATLDRPNGTLGATWDTSLNELGRQDTLELSRNLDLPRGRSLGGSLGMTYLPTGPSFMIGSLRYSQEVQTGQITVSANRSATVSSLDSEVLRTNLTASYSADLSYGASWSITARLIDSDFVNPINPDTQATSLSVRYNIPLTSDWDLATGVSWRETREEGSAASDRSTLFLSLQRSFTIRR